MALENAHHFEAALTDILEKGAEPRSRQKFAGEIERNPSVLSRLAPNRLAISTLAKILARFTGEEHERLVCSYIWDELERLNVDPHQFWKRQTNSESLWLDSLPPETQGDRRALGELTVNDPGLAPPSRTLPNSTCANAQNIRWASASGLSPVS